MLDAAIQRNRAEKRIRGGKSEGVLAVQEEYGSFEKYLWVSSAASRLQGKRRSRASARAKPKVGRAVQGSQAARF